MRRIESKLFLDWKRTLCINKRAPLFDKRALGQSRKAGEGRIPPLTQISFFREGHF